MRAEKIALGLTALYKRDYSLEGVQKTIPLASPTQADLTSGRWPRWPFVAKDDPRLCNKEYTVAVLPQHALLAL